MGRMDQARKVLNFVNKGVPGFSLDQELAIIHETLEEEARLRAVDVSQFAIFKGLDRKRFIIGCWPKVTRFLLNARTSADVARFCSNLSGYPFSVATPPISSSSQATRTHSWSPSFWASSAS